MKKFNNISIEPRYYAYEPDQKSGIDTVLFNLKES